jgi:cell wall-associated NlpC family hydrolase
VVEELLDDGAADLLRVLGGLALVAILGVMTVLLAVPLLVLGGARGGTDASTVDASPPRASPPPAASAGVVEVARRYLGVPYVFGGTDPRFGLDCSGLVQLVFRQVGVPLPRTAQMQFNATPRVSQDQLQPGDLVFFARTYADPNDWITHVGIYVGGGLQINAPTEGQVVSIQPVFSGFWGAHYAGAGRVRGTDSST